MNTHERITELKKLFRSLMNGVASASMHDSGTDYRINFGVESPRLAEIALSMGKSSELAQALWKEDVRECRLMAPMVQPVDDFSPELADVWLDTLKTPEEAQYLSMYLLQHLPYAKEKVFEWIADERENRQICGFHTAAWLLYRGTRFYARAANEFIDQCAAALHSTNAAVVKAAVKAMQKYAQQNDYQARVAEEKFNEYAKHRKDTPKNDQPAPVNDDTRPNTFEKQPANG